MAASGERRPEGRRSRFVAAAGAAAVVASALCGSTGADASVASTRPAALEVIGPSADTMAPWFWDDQTNQRTGAKAERFQLDDPTVTEGLSAWYRLSYVVGSDRLQVYENNPLTTTGPESAMANSVNVAWHVATTVLGRSSGPAVAGEIPGWARPRTWNTDGPSAGLVLALADLDILTPGRLAADLRVAGTGAIASDGVVTAVRMVDVKLAAARLAGADAFFAPELPNGVTAATPVSHQGTPSPDRTIGDWLATSAYEDAGRAAARRPGSLALVVVDDVRQAVAWLCGRTQREATCALAHAGAAVPLGTARPLQFPDSPATSAGGPPLR